MKREILFRGKKISNNEFVYGDIIRLDDDVLIAGLEMWAIDNEDGTSTLECARVNPETVGQFTGMTDKNGKRIFEGDRGIHKIFGEVYVKYLIQECAFVYVSKDSDHRMGHRNTGSGYTCDINFKVLGTIHHNK